MEEGEHRMGIRLESPFLETQLGLSHTPLGSGPLSSNAIDFD